MYLDENCEKGMNLESQIIKKRVNVIIPGFKIFWSKICISFSGELQLDVRPGMMISSKRR